MPCDTITTATIDLGKVNPNLLATALGKLGFAVSQFAYNEQTGKLVLKGRQASTTEIAQVKVAYSREVVFSQAARFGWKMKQVAENKYEVRR